MAKNYSYPRVTMSTLAKKHSHKVVTTPDTTILFAALVTEKGPDDKVVKVHSLSEFISTFGSLNEEFYDLNGQMALNVYNWLSNGGTLLVKRLKFSKVGKAMGYKEGAGEYILKNITLPEDILSNNSSESEKLDAALTGTYKFVDLSSVSLKTEEIEGGEKIPTLVGIENVKYIEESPSDYSEGYTVFYTSNDANGTKALDLYAIPYLKLTGSVSEITIDGVTYTKYNDGEKVLYQDNGGENGSVLKKAPKGYIEDTNGNFYKIEDVLKIEGGCVLLASFIYEQAAYKISAKYRGSYYSNISLSVERITAAQKTPVYYTFTVNYIDPVTKKSTTLERFPNKTEKTYLSALSASEFIDSVELDIIDDFKAMAKKGDVKEYPLNSISFDEDNALGYEDTLKLVEAFWSFNNTDPTIDSAAKYLLNRMETPIDIVLDAGYPYAIKKNMINAIRNDDAHIEKSNRPDIVLLLDNYAFSESGLRLNVPVDTDLPIESVWDNSYATNIAIYEQYFMVNDPTFTSQNIYVMPSYFLSKLIPFNDNTYGMQYPTAGLRRGILSDALYVNVNPNPDLKDEWFQARVNYVEKSSREYAFMSQRTFDGSSDMEYTALSFLNNERVLEKIKKEIEAHARGYLHEFNDAVTIANMTNVLNKYVANWIANRTLSLGVVEVVQNAVSENALDINLNIRFTNTIEVINVSIVIE